MRVGMLTGGGDAPGLNNVIKGVVTQGIKKYGYEFVNGVKSTKITSGSFGIKVIPNLIRLDFEKFPIITAAHEIVENHADGEEMIQKIQERLSEKVF